MNPKELAEAIQGLDRIFNLYRRHEGQLSAAQVRTRTLLSLSRSEILQTLSSSYPARVVSVIEPAAIDRREFAHPSR